MQQIYENYIEATNELIQSALSILLGSLWGQIILAILALCVAGIFFKDMFRAEDKLSERASLVETEAGQRAVQSAILICIARYTKWCVALLFIILLFMIFK